MGKRWVLISILAAAFLPVLVWGLLGDRGGKKAPRSREPRRIVSLCPPATEIICRLGAGHKLVALSEGAGPDEVKHLPRVGKAFGNVNVEAVVALDPDLAFCWRGAGEVLGRRGIPTCVVGTRDLEGVMSLVREIGRLVNRAEAAADLVGEMERRIRNIETRVAAVGSQPLVYAENVSPGRTRGPGTLTHDLIVRAGGRNIAGEEPVPYPILSIEYILAQNPDIIIVKEHGASPEEVMARDGWGHIKAVREKRVYRSPIYYTNYTPRCVEGLEQFAKWVHPEVFGK